MRHWLLFVLRRFERPAGVLIIAAALLSLSHALAFGQEPPAILAEFDRLAQQTQEHLTASQADLREFRDSTTRLGTLFEEVQDTALRAELQSALLEALHAKARQQDHLTAAMQVVRQAAGAAMDYAVNKLQACRQNR